MHLYYDPLPYTAAKGRDSGKGGKGKDAGWPPPRAPAISVICHLCKGCNPVMQQKHRAGEREREREREREKQKKEIRNSVSEVCPNHLSKEHVNLTSGLDFIVEIEENSKTNRRNTKNM